MFSKRTCSRASLSLCVSHLGELREDGGSGGKAQLVLNLSPLRAQGVTWMAPSPPPGVTTPCFSQVAHLTNQVTGLARALLEPLLQCY